MNLKLWEIIPPKAVCDMEFYCKTRIFAGQGILKELKTLNIGRLLLVCDPFFVQNGWAQKIKTLSGAAQFEIFNEISPDPTAALAAKGTAKMNAFCPDTVIALGGGSADHRCNKCGGSSKYKSVSQSLKRLRGAKQLNVPSEAEARE